MKSKIFFMERAINLARKGVYTTSPNPLVGCVIAEHNKILSEGYHYKSGSEHAEIIALKKLKKKTNKNISMFINLEPCCHHGKTGPCTESIINSGIKNIYISMLDPNPMVRGKGVKYLRSNGISVKIGLCKDSARLLNKSYILRMNNKTPYVVAKQALSIDSKISLPSKNKWISCNESRIDSQYLRAKACAILVGSKTVIKDNPELNVRLSKKDLGIKSEIRQPIRIVLDTNLKLNVNKYKFFKGSEKKIVFNSISSSFNEKKNIDFVKIKNNKDGLSINAIFRILAEKYEINNLMIEPGSKLLSTLLSKNFLDELVLYYCPIYIGKSGLNFINIKENVFNNQSITVDSVKKISNDVRITYKLKR
tara:strand:- start:2513 stop:3607 length:1095 start_codon:yes stop_codon:yes gene_type:complete